MKTTDHNVERLRDYLRDEAKARRETAKRLDELAKTMVSHVRDGNVTPHTFEFVAQEAIDLITHRSNVFPQSIARFCASLAAESAIEWDERRRSQAFNDALAAEMGTAS